MNSTLLSRFAQHRVAANLLMVILIMLGIWSLLKLNTQFFPNFALDVINVRVIWSGASAEDVEQAITIPLEQELRLVDNLHKISSTSATGVSAISLQFKDGSDMAMAHNSITESVSQIRNLPVSSEKPIITRVARYERIAKLILSNEQGVEELRQLAYDIKNDLLTRGIAKIDILGLPDTHIEIQIANKQLQELDLSLDDIANRIDQLSQDIPAGFVGQNNVARQLRSLAQQRDALGFAQLPVISDGQGQRLALSDIANVEQLARDKHIDLTVDQTPTVELTLLRTETSDALVSARILNQWLSEMEPSLPPSVHVRVYDQSWQLINERIRLLLTNGLGGLLLVVAILFIFLNGRIAFWVAIGIPVSFLTTLCILYLVGGTINMISLFGLIMAVGIIVDDAIVVAENSLSNLQAGDSPEQAAIKGARRMFVPVVSSSLTTIAAFLPLMLVGGIVGNILFAIPLVIICVVIASLIECFFILPAHMSMAFRHMAGRPPSNKRQQWDTKFNRFRDRVFVPLVDKAVTHRGITLALAISAFILCIGLVAGGRIGFVFFPSVESKIIYANASFTAGTPAHQTKQFLAHMQQTLRQTEQQFGENLIEIAMVRHGITSSGGGQGSRRGDQYGSLIVELSSPDQRNISNDQFIRAWQQHIKQPPGIEFFNITQRASGPTGQAIAIALTGQDSFTLKQAATVLSDRLRAFEGVSAVEDDLPWGQEQLIYQLTPVGQTLGLTVKAIGQQLRAAFDGRLVQIVQKQETELEVRVRLIADERAQLTSLSKINITLPDGSSVPLNTVVKLTPKKGFEALRHSNGQLAVQVTANVDKSLNNTQLILESLEATTLVDIFQQYGVSYFYEGSASDQAETMQDMKRGAIFGLIMIYLILAWVFASYSKPLVIMAVIPFGIIGAIIGHLLLNIEITILSLFGIVGLSGIVVNDSIILVSLYQQLRQQQIPVKTAIVQATQQRFRAVLLTSLTTIAGLTPLLFETSVQAQFLIPMATSITFGLGFATLLVLLVIPALLSLIESIFSAQRFRVNPGTSHVKSKNILPE